MRYQFEMATKGARKRPPDGVTFRRTKEFRDRLDTLLRTPGVTAQDVADKVSALISHKIHDSSIRKLRTKDMTKHPTSVLIGPLCRIYRWPVPPAVDVSAVMSSLVSVMTELDTRDPDRAEQFLEWATRELDAARKRDELRPTKDGAEKKSDT